MVWTSALFALVYSFYVAQVGTSHVVGQWAFPFWPFMVKRHVVLKVRFHGSISRWDAPDWSEWRFMSLVMWWILTVDDCFTWSSWWRSSNRQPSSHHMVRVPAPIPGRCSFAYELNKADNFSIIGNYWDQEFAYFKILTKHNGFTMIWFSKCDLKRCS